MTMSQIASSKKDFLQGEKSKELEEELTEFTLLDSLGIRPEEYIREFEQKGDVFPDIDA
jgi:sulfur carrier protein ThiS